MVHPGEELKFEKADGKNGTSVAELLAYVLISMSHESGSVRLNGVGNGFN